MRRGSSPAAVHRLLIAAAPLVAKALGTRVSVAAVPGL